MQDDHKSKYLKYKKKYLEFRIQKGGIHLCPGDEYSFITITKTGNKIMKVKILNIDKQKGKCSVIILEDENNTENKGTAIDINASEFWLGQHDNNNESMKNSWNPLNVRKCVEFKKT